MVLRECGFTLKKKKEKNLSEGVPSSAKEKSNKLQREPHESLLDLYPKEILSLCIGGLAILMVSAYFVLFMTSVSQLDPYDSTISSSDGVNTNVTTDTTQWTSEEGSDYDQLPAIEDGFGELEKGTEITAFGEITYTTATEVYVVTKQTASELGVSQPSTTDASGVVSDGAGGFSWKTEYNDNPVEIGFLNMEQTKANYELVYPDDCERLKEYLDDSSYSWYKITVRTNDKEILSKDETENIVKSVFGMKLDPNRSVILYSGGVIYKVAS